MVLQDSINLSIPYTRNTYSHNVLVQIIYSRVSGQCTHVIYDSMRSVDTCPVWFLTIQVNVYFIPPIIDFVTFQHIVRPKRTQVYNNHRTFKLMLPLNMFKFTFLFHDSTFNVFYTKMPICVI